MWYFQKVMFLCRDWWILIYFVCFCFWLLVTHTMYDNDCNGNIKWNKKLGLELQRLHVFERCNKMGRLTFTWFFGWKILFYTKKVSHDCHQPKVCVLQMKCFVLHPIHFLPGWEILWIVQYGCNCWCKRTWFNLHEGTYRNSVVIIIIIIIKFTFFFENWK